MPIAHTTVTRAGDADNRRRPPKGLYSLSSGWYRVWFARKDPWDKEEETEYIFYWDSERKMVFCPSGSGGWMLDFSADEAGWGAFQVIEPVTAMDIVYTCEPVD